MVKHPHENLTSLLLQNVTIKCKIKPLNLFQNLSEKGESKNPLGNSEKVSLKACSVLPEITVGEKGSAEVPIGAQRK